MASAYDWGVGGQGIVIVRTTAPCARAANWAAFVTPPYPRSVTSTSSPAVSGNERSTALAPVVMLSTKTRSSPRAPRKAATASAATRRRGLPARGCPTEVAGAVSSRNR